MKSWKLATLYFLFGYLFATIGGFGTYYLLSESSMWIFTMSFMPALYILLSYRYFADAHYVSDRYLDSEVIRLTMFWIVFSWILDAIVYVFITPSVMGFPLNWTFFRDHSPWIWLNYASVILVTAIGKLIYHKKSKRQALLP